MLTMLLKKIIPAVKTCFPTERPSIYGISISPNLLTITEDGSIELILDVRAMLSSPQPLMSAMQSTFGDLPEVNIEVKGLPGYLYTREDELLVQALLMTMEQHGEPAIPVERGGATDSRFFSPLGIPCVEIGVNGGNVHGPREFVDLNSLRKLPSIYLGIVKNHVALLP